MAVLDLDGEDADIIHKQKHAASEAERDVQQNQAPDLPVSSDPA